MNQKQMTLKEMLATLGNQRFFKPSEISDKTWKEQFENFEWDVEIEMEPYHDGEFIDDGKTHVVEPKWRPALDADGCLILKRC
jgi:hypothetical protein